MSGARARVHAHDPAVDVALAQLLHDAQEALKEKPVVVTDKHTLLPPSNDPHDYFSLSPYWWPDPSKPNGLPYIRRDGQTNPESKRDLDQPRVAMMGDRVQALALAYYLTGEERYAEAAAKQIKAWFLDPATHMNPHLRFSQLVRGNPNERGSGIIDTRWFIEVVDAVGMLQGSHAWTADDQKNLQHWCKQYLDWLLTSPNGAHERAAKNNHGSWYAAQTASYAMFVGDTAKARDIVNGIRDRIEWQIKPDGTQPQEMVRTRSMHYSTFNVEALSRLAEIGRKLGIDLWNYTAPSGGSLRAAALHVAQYVGREKEWPGQQITGIEQPVLLSAMRRALQGTSDAAFGAAIDRLNPDSARSDRSLLLFGGAAPSAKGSQSSADAAQHPSIFLSRAEAAQINARMDSLPVLYRSFLGDRAMVDHALANPTDVPQPGEAGGYAHERHKQNYREMQAAGQLYVITGETKYAAFVRDMLLKYAVLYPTLGANPFAKDQAPGKLFHQSLNEANWLVAVSIAYDCIYDFLTPLERARIEGNVLRPMADWLSVNQAKEFDRIHNHGTWATAAVGMLGLVIGDSSYVNRALYGTKRNGTGGFLRQLDLLFSPDGYYMEGPYYIRYALMPFYYFAEALNRARPDVHIYQYRDSILKKAVYAAVQTAYPNGVFAPINDASRTMDITAPEVVLAVDLAYREYGASPLLRRFAVMQNEVILNGAGLAVARDLTHSPSQEFASGGSVEFTDGSDGKHGGLGILRTVSGDNEISMLLMKYGVHGGGHGHFDELQFTLFDAGREVVPDYGFARWINIEPKFGGRYLPENDSYAMQTIAHNTIVVDETSQNNAKESAADTMSGRRGWFDANNPNAQGMSARAYDYWPGVDMQRTMLLLRDARLPYPVVVDLDRVFSRHEHQYDYALHFRGELITTSFKYNADTTQLVPLGTNYGYQHIWKEATATVDTTISMTWLDGSRYYTITTAGAPGTQVLLGRTGANDPNFNLIVEPMMIVRRHATAQLFASVIEPHGFFSEREERSLNARPRITNVRVIADTKEGSVVEVSGAGDLHWTIMAATTTSPTHSITAGNKTYNWSGNFAVEGLQDAH